MKMKSVLIKNFKTFDSEGIRLTMKDLTTLGKRWGQDSIFQIFQIHLVYQGV